MTVSVQLLAIQKASGMTQTQLARELGVSFVTLNRWINADVMPRAPQKNRVDALYTKHVSKAGTTDMELLKAKKSYLTKLTKKSPNPLARLLATPDVLEQIELSLTFHTNRLEGSSLTEHETALVLFENAALKDKTLIEQLEAKNHQSAIRHLFRYLTEGGRVDEALVRQLHGVLMNGIRDDAGRYRVHGVRIVGTFVPTANPIKVLLLMEQFSKRICKKLPKDIVQFVAETHAEFEQIHPFSDGNGRIGRLLANALLLKANYPPAVITENIRRDYLSALNKAQLTADFTPLAHIIADAIMEGQTILNQK